jgi:uncharacterized protein (DUF58 family)
VPVVTARFAVAATIAALVVLVLPATLASVVAVNALLLGVAVADFLRTPDPRRLTVERNLPDTLQLGATAPVSWRVSNPSPRQLRVRLADDLAPSLQARDRRASLEVPAHGTARAGTDLTPLRRGRFTIGRVTVRVDGPLGLCGRQRTLPLEGSLLVLPAFPSRRRAELAVRSARVAESGERTARGRGGGTEFEGLREYTIDDEFRRIDWAATARARHPVVRTYRPERNQTVIVLVDTGRTMAARVGDVPRLDHALDAALALTTVATRLGDRVGLVVFDEAVRAVLPPRGRHDQIRRVAERLADTTPRLVESDYTSAFAATLTRFRRRALLVVLSDLTPGSVEQTLLPALGLVTRRHEVVVAGVDDPDVRAWAHGEPAEAATAFRAAAAVTELDRRAGVIRRLRQAGARVIDATPDHLAAGVADAYLRLKSSGRL